MRECPSCAALHSRLEAAERERDEALRRLALKETGSDYWNRRLAEESERAWKAEAALSRARELADEWERTADAMKVRRWPEAQAADEQERDTLIRCADALNAALAAAPDPSPVAGPQEKKLTSEDRTDGKR